MNIAQFVDGIASKGRYHFTPKEAAKATDASYVATKAAIGRLRKKGGIATPFRGFNVIVPPEYRRLGCLPPEQFAPQLMEHLGLDYYVGLLSAAEIHGAAHQRPQVFQVVVKSNRPDVRCGQVRIQFAARSNVADMPTIRHSTPRGYAKVASPAATAFDIVGYANRCGGLDNIATILSELVEVLKPDDLVRIASLSPVPWSQRLGYLLERVSAGDLAKPLADHVARKANEYVPLNPKRHEAGKERSKRWKVRVNDDVEADL